MLATASHRIAWLQPSLTRIARVVLLAIVSLPASAISQGVRVEVGPHGDWDEAIDLRNDSVRLVVVPAIGRILHYGWIDEGNLLYTNPELDGVVLAEGESYTQDGSPKHAAFGGDRVWTTSEELFVEIRGRRDLPDHWTDGSPNRFKLVDRGVVIETPVSRLLGISVRRQIKLSPEGTVVEIAQTLTKHQPAANERLDSFPVTIWNLTKLHGIRQTWQPLADQSVFKNGYYVPSWSLYRVKGNFQVEKGLVKLTPQKINGQKIGVDSPGWVAGWNGETLMVEQFDYLDGETYPDGGTSSAVYTNPAFTELECLSPERVLEPGQSIEHTIRWELHRIDSEEAAEDCLMQLQEPR